MTEPAAKLLLFLKRRPGMSHADFRTYYETRHVPLCLKYMGGALRYIRRYVESPDGNADALADTLGFDVITELWFDSAATARLVAGMMQSGTLPAEVIEDEEQLFDRPKTRLSLLCEAETTM